MPRKKTLTAAERKELLRLHQLHRETAPKRLAAKFGVHETTMYRHLRWAMDKL